MSEVEVRADLHRCDAEEAANDDKEISGDVGDSDNEIQFDAMDVSDDQEARTTRNRGSKKMTQAAFIILGLQIEETQLVYCLLP